MNYRDEWNKIGYNQEELYFEKLNRELIHKLKAQRTNQTTQTTQPMGQVLQFRSKPAYESSQTKKKAA